MLNKKCFFILLFVLYGAGLTLAGDKTVSDIINFEQENLTINAEKIPLKNIVAEIRNKCSVKIEGLEYRKDEKITYFSKKGALENVLKSFLRHLGEKNYAFEFSSERLMLVAVMPEANVENLLPATRSNEREKHDDTVNVVKVAGIIGRSQAQSSGLIKGDIILEYDGIAISNVDQLIKATKERSNTDQVEIFVLRENYRLRFIINGGFIGVRIKNASIAKDALEVF